MKLHRRSVADGTVWPYLVVVSTPSLAFSACVVEAHEPVGIQAFGAELAVERFDKGVVGRFAWPAKVERDAFHVRPEIQFLADKLRAIVDADGPGITKLGCTAFESFNNIFAGIALANSVGRRQARERVDDGQRAYLRSFEELVVHKVHRPDVVRFHGRCPV